MSLGYNAFYRTTDYDDLDVDVASYAVDSLGAGVNIGYPISETSRLTFGLTVQQDEIKTGVYTVDEIFDFTRRGRRQLPELQGVRRLVRVDPEQRRTGQPVVIPRAWPWKPPRRAATCRSSSSTTVASCSSR